MRSSIIWSTSDRHRDVHAHGDDPVVEILDHLEQHAGVGMFIPRAMNPASRSSIIWSSSGRVEVEVGEFVRPSANLARGSRTADADKVVVVLRCAHVEEDAPTVPPQSLPSPGRDRPAAAKG